MVEPPFNTIKDGVRYTTPGYPTLMVASSTAINKARANFVCRGKDDQDEINEAFDALPIIDGPVPRRVGSVMLTEGIFDVSAPIIHKGRMALRGAGVGYWPGATTIRTSVPGINVIEAHGSSWDDMNVGWELSDLSIEGIGNPASNGISVEYSANLFRMSNVYIIGFKGQGLRIVNSHDARLYNIHVTKCGDVDTEKAALFLDNSNDIHFYSLNIEPWIHLAVELGPDASLNRFVSTKLHGACYGDYPLIYPALLIKGTFNQFINTLIARAGAGVDAITIDGDVNQLYNTVFSGAAETLLLIKATRYGNIIDGFTYPWGADVVNGLRIEGDDNFISKVKLISITGKGIIVVGSGNNFSDIQIAGQLEGLDVSGNDNTFVGVSPRWVGQTAGEAAVFSGSHNRIFGGMFNGPGNKTIQFVPGADYNTVIGARVMKAIIDAGVGNKFRDVRGYVNENSGTATITATQISINVDHGLDAIPTRVILTPTTDTGGKRYYVSAKGAGTFTITIDSAYGADITFDWKAQAGEG